MKKEKVRVCVCVCVCVYVRTYVYMYKNNEFVRKTLFLGRVHETTVFLENHY
jgi:hypothetical protein